MRPFRVKLLGITWDDGKGEYDVSEAPINVEVVVNAEDADDAVQWAMDEATEQIGSLIIGVKKVEVI